VFSTIRSMEQQAGDLAFQHTGGLSTASEKVKQLEPTCPVVR